MKMLMVFVVFSSCWSRQVFMRLCLISCVLQRWRARRAYFHRRIKSKYWQTYVWNDMRVLSDRSWRCVSDFADTKSQVHWQRCRRLIGFWALNDETSAINHQSAHPLLRNTHFHNTHIALTVCWWVFIVDVITHFHLWHTLDSAAFFKQCYLLLINVFVTGGCSDDRRWQLDNHQHPLRQWKYAVL